MGWVTLLGEGVSRKLVKKMSKSPLAASKNEPWVLPLQALPPAFGGRVLFLVAFLQELLFLSHGREQRMLLQPWSSWGFLAQILCPSSRCLCMQQFTLGTSVLFNHKFGLRISFWGFLPLFS